MLFLRLRSATSRMRCMLSHNATANAFIGSANAAPNTARRDRGVYLHGHLGQRISNNLLRLSGI